MNPHHPTPILVGIVVFNTPLDILQATLKSVQASTVKVSVVVLCNSGQQEYKEKVATQCHALGIPCKQASANRGFGAGHNEIWQAYPSTWYICCNPDVSMAPNAIECLISYGESYPQTSLLMPKVLNTDGSVQPLARKHPTPWQWCSRQWWRLFPKLCSPYEVSFDYSKTQPIEFVTGCFFAARTSLLQKLNGFDERFFLYAEDADLSRRASQLGTNVYVANAIVTHQWNQGWQSTLHSFFQHLRSLALYWHRHGLFHPLPQPFPINLTTPCSVALCTYNGALFLRKQLDSILKQLLQNDEVIVGDDLSTDGTRDILNAYAAQDKRIKILPPPPKRLGVVQNFERVLKHCTGDILFLSDQDDMWHADKRSRIVSEFHTKPHTWVVVSDANLIDANGQMIEPPYQKKKGFNLSSLGSSFVRTGFLGCAMAFRKELLTMAIPIPRRAPMHDWWLGLICLTFQKHVQFIDSPLIHYRRHGHNASPEKRRNWWPIIKDRIVLAWYVFTRWLSFWIKGGT